MMTRHYQPFQVILIDVRIVLWISNQTWHENPRSVKPTRCKIHIRIACHTNQTYSNDYYLAVIIKDCNPPKQIYGFSIPDFSFCRFELWFCNFQIGVSTHKLYLLYIYSLNLGGALSLVEGLEDYTPVIPDPVLENILARSGLSPQDPRVRLYFVSQSPVQFLRIFLTFLCKIFLLHAYFICKISISKSCHLKKNLKKKSYPYLSLFGKELIFISIVLILMWFMWKSFN